MTETNQPIQISVSEEKKEQQPQPVKVDQDPRKGGTSASSAEADLLCPGRHQAQKGLPNETTTWSEFGQKVHHALATGKVDGLSTEEEDIVLSCAKIEQSLIQALFGPQVPQLTVIRQKRFWVKIKADEAGSSHFIHSGEPDVIYRLGSRAAIFDYKSLAGDVPTSPHNLQLRDYVVLAAGEMKLTDVVVAVIQPLVTHTPEPVLYDRLSIKQAEEDMFKRIRASNTPGAPRIAGVIQCQNHFCRARFRCDEYASWIAPTLPVPLNDIKTPVLSWTPEQRMAFVANRKIVEKWIADCEREIKKGMSKDPNFIPGYKLGNTGSITDINNPQELFNRFSNLGGTIAQFMGCIDVGKGKLKDAIRAATGLKGKALDDKLDEMLIGIATFTEKEKAIRKEK